MSREPLVLPNAPNQSLIQIISQDLPTLNKTQAKVARTILADPKSATQSSIANLAKKSAVSEPSVNRFCKRFKAKGFPDLKLRLAESLASGVCFVNPQIEPSDKVASFAPKTFDTAINNLVRVRQNICHQRINQIVEAFIKARRIYFFGLGSSGIVARDAANQFLKLNLPVSSSDDILNQKMFASSSHKQDVFFLVSDTNDNKEMIEVAQIAKKNGAIVISLASKHCQLSDKSNLSLHADFFELPKKYLLISPRIVHLVILDVLAIGVALKIGQYN